MSVAYAYDSKLETFVREQRPFAPALSVNARTDGRGVLTIGAAYSYLQYENFEGQDRNGVVFPTDLGITTDRTAAGPFAGMDSPFTPFTAEQNQNGNPKP